jgi:hypothetical protein
MIARNFFAELKRRNVYKVAVAYAVVGWLVIQVATSTFPVLEIPNWATKLVIAVVLLGFPIALVVAWAFEMTPEGIKRTEDVSPDEKIPQWSRRKFAAFILLVVICAAALLGYQVVGTARWAVRRDDDGLRSAASLPVSPKSIAVLPLLNESGDPKDDYFSDGLSEELIAALAQIRELKVIGSKNEKKSRKRLARSSALRLCSRAPCANRAIKCGSSPN